MAEEYHEPFKQLGIRLKFIRQKLHETVSEVSGAVEIDEPALQRIEQGNERPSEDILMLLINHFGMHEDEAGGLWQLAGYDQPSERLRDVYTSDAPNGRPTILVVAVDPRAIYSDSVRVEANEGGVVVSFYQQSNGSSRSLSAACVGMSREQAKKLIVALKIALDRSNPRMLSDGASRDNS
jgi:transcriptional regulator with XRE-family HTH domain